MGMDVYGNDPKIEKRMNEFPIYSKYEDMPWGDREKDPKWKKDKDEYYSQWKEYENSNPGVYFRNNCWWWRPLWDYCAFVDRHYKLSLIDEELYQSGHHNDGAGLDEKESIKLAMYLQMSIEDGTAKEYANEYLDMIKEDLPYALDIFEEDFTDPDAGWENWECVAIRKWIMCNRDKA